MKQRVGVYLYSYNSKSKLNLIFLTFFSFRYYTGYNLLLLFDIPSDFRNILYLIVSPSFPGGKLLINLIPELTLFYISSTQTLESMYYHLYRESWPSKHGYNSRTLLLYMSHLHVTEFAGVTPDSFLQDVQERVNIPV